MTPIGEEKQFGNDMDDLTEFQFQKHFAKVQAEIHANGRRKGFWEDSVPNLGEKLALVHSEVSEALEALRVNDRAGFATELADIVIRVMDIAEHEELDLGAAILDKHRENLKRPKKHGKLF